VGDFARGGSAPRAGAVTTCCDNEGTPVSEREREIEIDRERERASERERDRERDSERASERERERDGSSDLPDFRTDTSCVRKKHEHGCM